MAGKSNESIYDDKNDRNIIIERYDGDFPISTIKNSYFEIIYIFDGHCTKNIGLHRLTLQKGDIIIISPETIHNTENVSSNSIIFDILLKYDNFYVNFAPLMKGNNIVNKFFSEGIHDKNPIKYLLFHTGDDKILQNNVLQMYDDQANGDDYTDNFLIGCLVVGFVHIMRKYNANFEMNAAHRSSLPDDFLVMKYIQDNLATITLADVAEKFNFSISHCSRLIKKATGHGFNEWKRILRLRMAKNLLLNTNYTVIEIANLLGYLNPENFIRLFQREFHLTPTQYRKQSGKSRQE